MIAAHGSVVGIDIGYSPTRKTNAVCRLYWSRSEIDWRIKRYVAAKGARVEALREIVGTEKILAVALDGPLRNGFDQINRYRIAERMLTKRLQKIGKPGQSSSPVGKRLNEETNLTARAVLDFANVDRAKHQRAICRSCVVEAFPSSFMGLMLARPEEFRCKRGNRSDLYYEYLASSGALKKLVNHFLPNRKFKSAFQEISDHDERASVICAITAIGVAGGNYSAAGDDDGWIILPPRQFIRSWAWDCLQRNAIDCSGALFSTER